MIITLLQLTQMIVGCWINFQAWQYKSNGDTCQVTDENLKVSLIMYGTYFLLFAHFFLGSYIWKRARPNQKAMGKHHDNIDDQQQQQQQQKQQQKQKQKKIKSA
jgi:hypothetical protein